MSSLAPLLEGFFTERLLHQRQASPHTVAAYRDTFRLLLGFVRRQRRRAPAQLDLHDLDAELILIRRLPSGLRLAREIPGARSEGRGDLTARAHGPRT